MIHHKTMNQPAKTARIQSYDIYRGLLLAAMVVFHILVNLTPLRFDQHFFYWVPMGFVTFLGVILARFLQGKTSKKLSLALKVLACFVILNIPNYLRPKFNFWALIKGDQAILSFEILMPMALLIFASILFDRFAGSRSQAAPGNSFISASGAALTLSTIIILNFSGFYSYNLAFLLYGIFGYFIAKNTNLHQIAEKPTPLLTVICILLTAAPFILLYFGYFFDFLFLIQVFATYLLLGKILPQNNTLAFLGRHSFSIYVGHILIIKLISLFLLII